MSCVPKERYQQYRAAYAALDDAARCVYDSCKQRRYADAANMVAGDMAAAEARAFDLRLKFPDCWALCVNNPPAMDGVALPKAISVRKLVLVLNDACRTDRVDVLQLALKWRGKRWDALERFHAWYTLAMAHAWTCVHWMEASAWFVPQPRVRRTALANSIEYTQARRRSKSANSPTMTLIRLERPHEEDCAICCNAGCNCKTQCGHMFHLRCISAWFGIRVQCPVCRAVPTVKHNTGT